MNTATKIERPKTEFTEENLDNLLNQAAQVEKLFRKRSNLLEALDKLEAICKQKKVTFKIDYIIEDGHKVILPIEDIDHKEIRSALIQRTIKALEAVESRIAAIEIDVNRKSIRCLEDS